MKNWALFRRTKLVLLIILFVGTLLISLFPIFLKVETEQAYSHELSHHSNQSVVISPNKNIKLKETLALNNHKDFTQAITLSNRALALEQQGQFSDANKLIQDSLKLLDQHSHSTEQQTIYAATLDIYGHILNSQGQFSDAIDAWQRAESIYRDLNLSEQTTKNQINQSVAFQQLGLNQQACQALLSALDYENQACPSSNEPLQFNPPHTSTSLRGLHYLGSVLSTMGRLEQAQQVLANTVQNPMLSAQEQAKLYVSLGNNLRGQTLRLVDVPNPKVVQTDLATITDCSASQLPLSSSRAFEGAIVCYQKAIQHGDETTQLQAQLNQASLISEVPTELFESHKTLLETDLTALQPQLDQLPSSQTAVLTRLKWVQTGLCFADANISSISPVHQPCHNQQLTQQSTGGDTSMIAPLAFAALTQQAEQALQQAQAINNPRSIANAYGYLGAIALQQNDLVRGQRYTELALQQTASYQSPETNYLWLWQLGRIYRQQGRTQDAIAAYQSTQQILQNLRADLVTATPDVQFAFRDSVEPVYRELVDLLLPNDEPSQENLAQARDVIESLQLAELHNFYQQACLDAQPKAIESIDKKAAVIYAIALQDRLAVITSVPDQPLSYHSISAKNETHLDDQTSPVDQVVAQLISSISLPSRDRLAANRTIYDWLIRPSLSAFEAHDIKTLVFVLDGALREVPIAALHNGQNFLIEDYSVALTPGLQLLSPQALNSQRPRALAAGVSESVEGRPALPEVVNELQSIAGILPTEILLNGDFTSNSLEESIQDVPYNVVHLATHAQFSSKADQTFLLAWDKRINVNDLDTVLRERQRSRINRPIELLTLSACQTAAGDKRAALGLAGVAMRSGARSTIASLWSIPDRSTAELMQHFYSALDQPGISKADALRQAQIEMLRSTQFNEPRYWSAFVLVGNWL